MDTESNEQKSHKRERRSRRRKTTEADNSLKITIDSNKTLLEILDDKRKILKLTIIIAVLVLTIFIGLAFITVSIKSVYPYNLIKVNAFGTTTMQYEDREINYWLFNTAQLWANSGIHVEKGDKLTIRSSGKFNTAIHHMVNSAEHNGINSDWVGPEGREKESNRDKLRAEFRLCRNQPPDALIMQLVPDSCSDIMKNRLTRNKLNEDYIYFIGKEYVDLRVCEDGTLYFAVNDIVLTESVINSMIDYNDSLIINRCKIKNNIKDTEWNKYNKEFLDFGPYPGHDNIKQDTNEMIYYKNMGRTSGNGLNKEKPSTYYNAWYDDNVGSFLIVVERKKN